MSADSFVRLPDAVPAAVRARVVHQRRAPFAYGFAHSTTLWLVDVASPGSAFPRWLRPLADIRGADHFGPDDAPLAAKVRGYLRAQQLGWTGRRVLMLAGARSLGHVFDPLSTFFCFDAEGRLEGVLAEVHNTYGERHCYPLAVDRGRAEVDKAFYVSPFFTVDGRYDITVRLDPTSVAVSIALTQDGHRVFTGSVTGDLRAVDGPRSALREVLRNPAPGLRTAALIRLHGIRLWLRRLPVAPRPRHEAPKGMT